MKILFADKFPAARLEHLRGAGHECVLEPDLTADRLPSKVGGFEALVVRSTRVEAGTLAAGEGLKLVIRAGAGTNTIDKAAASERGVRVCNVPGRNAVAVAELTLGLLIAIDRRIPDNVADLRDGRWNKKRWSEAQGLFGRSMGIVGFGAIGMAVADRAWAFGLKLHGVYKAGRPIEVQNRLASLGVECVDDLETLAERCDILSFHVPGTEETRGMLGRALLERVRPGAIVLNLSRGDVVDEEALIEAMDGKGVRAGLDVYANEPGSGEAEIDSPLACHPNVYGTHHIGASTAQAQDAVADGVVEILDAYQAGEVLNCVNEQLQGDGQ
jgi:D-3-phosphoglycerate dehydrogenase